MYDIFNRLNQTWYIKGKVLYPLELAMETEDHTHYFTCNRVFTVSMGVVITDEQAPATIPAVAWTVTISIWDGFLSISSL